MKLKEKIRPILPWFALYLYRKLHSLPEDFPVLVPFLFKKTNTPTKFLQRLRIIYKCYRISYSVKSPHMESEMIRVISGILSIPPSIQGVVVEAGAVSCRAGTARRLISSAGSALSPLSALQPATLPCHSLHL